MKSRAYQVSDVARIAGVSARTLRYYDEIGLLVPSAHTEAGYRVYQDSDLLRLQQIMLARELGLALEEVRKLLDDPTLDRKALLIEQRGMLVARARATDAMIRSVDAALALVNEDTKGSVAAMEMNQIFTGFNPYEDEARARWGGTPAFEESTRRGAKYSAEDWRQIGAGWETLMKETAEAFEAHAKPDAVVVMDIAERYRQWLTRWFFVCSPAKHAAMADMFEADPRFAKVVDQHAAGLAPFWSAAIRANAARLGRTEPDP